MEYKYEFAGIVLKVQGSESTLYRDHGALTPFLTSQEAQEHRVLEFEMVEHLTEPEGVCEYQDAGKRIYRTTDAVVRYLGADRGYMRIERLEHFSRIQCRRTEHPNHITPKTVLNAMEAEHLIVQNRGFLLHASFIRIGDRGVVFSAPSGTGKSTQADLWCRLRNAELINGDRVAIRLEGDQIYACGIPFSGSSGVGKSAKLPLAAIVYLSQCPEVSIKQLKGFDAFRKVWEGSSVNIWDSADVSVCSQTVLDALEVVPVYHLACTPDEEAVKALEQVLE